MLLKEKYNLNHLIKQKRFVPLDPSVFLERPEDTDLKKKKSQGNNRYRLNKIRSLYSSKSQGLKGSTLKTLNSILNINKYSFLENHQRFKYKQIQTYFRNIISDQKKRTAFAKDELRKAILKTLLSVNQKTFLFTRRMLFNSPKMQAFESLPLVSQKAKLKAVLELSSPKKTQCLFKTNGMFESLTRRLSLDQGFFMGESIFYQNSNSRYARLGPVLFLEKTINPLFTEKTKSLSRIRNRCLLSGRSSIVGKYRLSRICFRHYVNRGLIPGLIKNKK